MAQVKIYGTAARLPGRRDALSDVVHSCVVEAFAYPPEKRFHRFFALGEGDFRYPDDRSADYTLIEIVMFEGRSIPAKKELYRLLYARFEAELGIAPIDLEISLVETPRHDWGIRGVPGDALGIGYRVEV